MPLLSIIVPVWNAARWLDACVQSVLAQTCDFELLLLDDGSTDGSGTLCDRWAAQDPRIRVVHKEDTGPADTRNVGLTMAKGTYAAFLDSDDELLPGVLSEACRLMETDHYDMVSFGYVCQFPDHSYPMVCPTFSCVSREEFWPHFEEYYHATGQFCFVWNKLYRLDLIRKYDIHFDASLFNGEDICFNFDYFCHLQRFCCLGVPGYRYWNRGDGLSRKLTTDHLEVCERTIRWANRFFAAAGAPADLPAAFEQGQLLANVSGYYSALTDSSLDYTLAQRVERLRKILRTPRYRRVLAPWLSKQCGVQYLWLRFALRLNSPLLTALPVALKSRLRGNHHA